MGNGQKRELPVGSWPETGGQKYEGSEHSTWGHVISQHHLPPVSGRTPTGTSRFLLVWSAPTRFWPHFVVFCCSSPVYSIWAAWRRTTLLVRERQKANGTETKSCSSTAAINSTDDSFIFRSNIYSSRQHRSNNSTKYSYILRSNIYSSRQHRRN